MMNLFVAVMISGMVNYADDSVLMPVNETVAPAPKVIVVETKKPEALSKPAPREVKVSLPKSVCKDLQRNDAHYISGVDVRGNKVKSANLEDNNMMDIIVPINIDIAKKYGYYDEKGLNLGVLYSGDLKVMNGQTYLNGYLVDRDDVAIFTKACEE